MSCRAASGALLPPPVEVLWLERRVEVGRDTGFCAVSTGIDRDVVLDGGDEPTIRLRGDRWILAGNVSGGFWSGGAAYGMADGTSEVSAGGWSVRWIPPDERTLEAFLAGSARGVQGRVAFLQDQGNVLATASARLGFGSAAVEGELSRRLARGAIELAPSGESPLALSWNSSGWDASGGLGVDFAEQGKFHGRVLRSESHPEPVEGRYRLETRTTSSGWSAEWEPSGWGPWLVLDARHVELRSSGWSDTLGSDRKFHDFLVRASWRSAAGGIVLYRWRFGVHAEEREFDAPRASFFSPFLAWNSLDHSVWSPVDQILSDQREHVSGTAEYRACGAGASWARRGRRLDAGMSGDVSWRAVDIHVLHRSTSMEMLGMGWHLETDSVGAPRLRIVLLSLGSEAALHLGRFGDLVGRGRIGIPLWLKRLRRDGASPASTSSGGGEGAGGGDMQGLWAIGAGWRGVW